MSIAIYLEHDDYLSEGTEGGTVTLTSVETKVDEPKMHRVLLHNDDFTPMEFVVDILENYFDKSPPQATQIMLDVHKKGVGLCGVFTKEIAETKTMMVVEKAKTHQYPLKCTHEEDDLTL
ncbi:MAG: ATP-dependent Clp protease adapter ClpS [Proteobacteria bacterium]|nr:ATP-dependent Clp protease adapter ClpS [Pseudomonadota bacterium]